MMLNGAKPARSIIILGLESRYGFEVIDIVTAAGLAIRACMRSAHDTHCAGPYPHCGSLEVSTCRDAEFVVPLLTPGRRKLRADEGAALGMLASRPISHPSAVVSSAAQIAPGALIGPGSVIGSNVSCGGFFMANRLASAGHDCVFGEFCTIGPSSTICGGCVIDDGVYVGAGAVVLPKLRLGRNAVIGAGSVVTHDVPSHSVVVGNPARVIRKGIAGYRDIGV